MLETSSRETASLVVEKEVHTVTKKKKKKNVFLILEVIMAGALDKWMMAAAALTSDRIGVTPLPFGVRR